MHMNFLDLKCVNQCVSTEMKVMIEKVLVENQHFASYTHIITNWACSTWFRNYHQYNICSNCHPTGYMLKIEKLNIICSNKQPAIVLQSRVITTTTKTSDSNECDLSFLWNHFFSCLHFASVKTYCSEWCCFMTMSTVLLFNWIYFLFLPLWSNE